MAMQTCGTCHYLTRTSPTQRFLLCKFWSAKHAPNGMNFGTYAHSYVITHCHMQPEATACEFWQQRKASDGAIGDTRQLLCTR